MGTTTIRNFGQNISFQPTHYYTPASEAELLSILNRHRGENFRTAGRLHAWSAATVTEGVLLDLRNLNQVTVQNLADGPLATVGAGCQIKRLLVELDRHDLTMPSVGLITEQTIAGAISTGTHGSGRHSLSHYIDSLRVAAFDSDSGEATIRLIEAGDELMAARCSLGCLGVIVSVSFRPRRQYLIEEHLRRYASLDDILAAEEDFPLQQFFLMPWLWSYFAQHRREAGGPPSTFAPFYQLYWFLGLDITWHLILISLARFLRSPKLIRGFFERALPVLVIQNWRVTDKAERLLVIEHELFRHIEIEVFVRRRELPAALRFTEGLLKAAAGFSDESTAIVRRDVADLGLASQFDDLAGQYHHHYPICVRKVLADDTLLSPAAGDGNAEAWYAISIISFARPDDRESFSRLAELLAKSTAKLLGARPHWGKVCPIDQAEVAELYPQLERFKECCAKIDPKQNFLNRWLRRTLGFETETLNGARDS